MLVAAESISDERKRPDLLLVESPAVLSRLGLLKAVEDPRQCAVCPTRCARAESNTPVSVTIPMEGIKHVPDDGLSASKRDEDLPTIQEECPSCSNDLACAQPPSSPPAPARKCSPEGLVAPADTTAPCSCAPQTRGRQSFTRVPRADGNGSKTRSYDGIYPFDTTRHIIGLRVFGGTEGSAE